MNVQNPSASRGIVIQAVDLVKNYGTGSNMVHALRGVNVSFERGKFTAIMGPSGSGKSTLMHTLAGLDSATSGHILFGGADLTRMEQVCSRISALLAEAEAAIAEGATAPTAAAIAAVFDGVTIEGPVAAE